MFLDAGEFPFTRTLEANWETIRRELETLSESAFMPFPERELYDEGWDVFGLYAFGRKLGRNCRFCPETTRLVETIPGMVTAGFSSLKPATHIKPHVGYTNTVLRCHLGLIVPEGCVLRVGEETRVWEEGKCTIFDDTSEHEAWNRSDKTRVVLLIDFTPPGVSFEPPEIIKSKMEAIQKLAQGHG